MDDEELASELRKLASHAEVIIQAAQEVKGLPPGLTAGVMDATLRLRDILSLLAREIEMLASYKDPQ